MLPTDLHDVASERSRAGDHDRDRRTLRAWPGHCGDEIQRALEWHESAREQCDSFRARDIVLLPQDVASLRRQACGEPVVVDAVWREVHLVRGIAVVRPVAP